MPYLIYGANGYTGEIIAKMAAKRGHRPILGGRNRGSVERVARELGLEARIFLLDSPSGLDAGLSGVTAVLHCAGPFAHTSGPMLDGCLRRGVHYLDITGEALVFENCAGRDQEAKAAGVMVLPGSGFDVVPSDCLAAHLHRRLPSATHLALGFQSVGRLSQGTAITTVENINSGGLIRRNGKLVRVPIAHKTRLIDFGSGPVKAIAIPWGDVATAFYSTRIPNVEVYVAAPLRVRLGVKLTRIVGPVLSMRSVQTTLKRAIRSGPAGPSAAQRARGQTFLWGEAIAADGRRAVSRLRTPEGYTLTALTALAMMERVLRGEIKAGYQTPSTAFGADFILEIEGVTRTDDSEDRASR